VPQLQNPDRVAAAREAVAAGNSPVLILDDAFQHRRLARDLDIVLIDALEPFGHGHLLPRGLLREPVAGLARAQVVALSRADAVSQQRREELKNIVAKLAPAAVWLELTHEPAAFRDHSGQSEPLARWQGKKLAAFAGIGNPAGFQHTLAGCGLNVVGFRALADHQEYTPAIVDSLAAWLRTMPALDAVVCTHKDLVKLPRAELTGVPLRALQIELQITRGEAALLPLLEALLEFAIPGIR
jgi:tetraacyldisaccharide 4'-kinase